MCTFLLIISYFLAKALQNCGANIAENVKRDKGQLRKLTDDGGQMTDEKGIARGGRKDEW